MIEFSINVGTIGYPVAKRLVLSEVDVIELTDAGEAPPKTATAKKWRKEAPGNVSFTVQLPRYLFETPGARTSLGGDPKAYGGFQVTDENRRLFDKTVRFADALESKALVLLTPAEFTPSGGNQRALAGFLKAMDVGDRELVWEPRGPWEYEKAAIFAAEQGMTLAVDPLRDPPPPGVTAYFRLGPFAVMGSRLGVYDLELLLEAAYGFKRVTCVFQTPHALDDVRNLKKIVAEPT